MASSTASTSKFLKLPYISVQPSFPDAVHDIGSGGDIAVEDCWISVYCSGKPSVHGKLRVAEKDGGGGAVEVEAREGVTCEMMDGKPTTLSISCEALSIAPTLVHFPLRSDRLFEPHPIHCFDIAPNRSRYVVGGNNGLLRVVELPIPGSSAHAKQLALKGHVSDLTVVRFLPSSEVVLSASLDMSIRVFSALDASNVRTLTGHTKSVSDLYVLGKGRRILSSSLDGSIRMWNVAESKVEKTWRFDQPISAFVVGDFDDRGALGEGYPELDSLFVIAAHTNGTATVLPLGTPTSVPIATLRVGSAPLHSIAYDVQSRRVALGARNGHVALFRLPALDRAVPSSTTSDPLRPILTFSRSASTVHRLVFASDDLFIASGDGLPFRVKFSLDSADDPEGATVVVTDEYAGLDCVAATSVSISGDGWVWISGVDGVLRRYKNRSVA